MILSTQPQLHPTQLFHHRAPKVADKRMERALEIARLTTIIVVGTCCIVLCPFFCIRRAA